MATYAIGDIQGCFSSFQEMLSAISFDPSIDTLWMVGDLVNRGPDSLAVLRYIKGLGQSAVTVLGNHDLHLLAVHAGVAQLHRHDTLQEILNAPDCIDLLDWLRHQPLMYHMNHFVLVHAGILPQWSTEQALTMASLVQEALRSDQYQSFLPSIYKSSNSRWRNDLPLDEQLGVITNIFTRMRVCTPVGEINLTFQGPLEQLPAGYFPWFEIPPAQPRPETIIFGHWSALGKKINERYLALDAGCVWGNRLVAVRLEDRQVFEIDCDRRAIGKSC